MFSLFLFSFIIRLLFFFFFFFFNDTATTEIYTLSLHDALPILNISSSLNQQLKGRPCEVYAVDIRVKVRASGLYTYPDVAVACAEPQFEDDFVDTLLNPILLIEVLSQSTERYDRIAKTSYYRTIDSLKEHLLVAQNEVRVEQYYREANDQWLLTEHLAIDSAVNLKSVGCTLILSDVYERITFEPARRATR